MLCYLMANLKKKMRKYGLSGRLSTIRDWGESQERDTEADYHDLFCFSTRELTDFLNPMFFIFQLL